ncbi:hypothetical protein [Actinospica robiniae]|uniref:Uncharacterized protein n=1 Tax=Actinospica robiniae DSM 44927 TaxID=479430 RepID=W9DZ61_9ACTN|nr:hypothetical protein [Actinospica robiniae]ETA71093.1 hypothetical protein ActroDRAFT_0115 [Actinospica robiniae DSM 44927]
MADAPLVESAALADTASENRSAGRGPAVWVAQSTAFGLLAGPLTSASVNHGHFVAGSLFADLLLIVWTVVFTFVAAGTQWHGAGAASVRVLAVLLLGSVFFMLPRADSLAATGSITSWDVLTRWLLCCIPYPLVALLIHPSTHRYVRVAPVAGLVCLALAWPQLLHHSIDTVAAQTRARFGIPGAMLLMVDPQSVSAFEGFGYSEGVLLSSYDSGGETPLPVPDYEADDLDMVVYKAEASTPCASIGKMIDSTVGDNGASDQSCLRLADGRWQYVGVPENTAVTQIELYDGYYVALTVDSASLTPIPASQLPALFATLHHPDNAELAALGESADQGLYGWLF